MRRLYYTARSPYARKVWLLLLHKQLPFELITVDLANRSPEFVGLNPHGKVPVFVDEDGTVVVDSTVICEYLEDRYPTGTAGDWRTRLAVRELEELGDSLGDQAIAAFFGRQEGHTARADKAERVAARLMDTLEERAPADGAPFLGTWTYADAAVLSALGYWRLRLGEGWREGRPRLSAWVDAVEAQPDSVTTRPRL